MTVTEFLDYTNDALRGTDEDAPNIGTEEANQWLRTLNRVTSELYEDTNVLWNETWEVKSLGTVSASATPSFNTDTTLIAPSDHVYAVDTSSQTHYYDITEARRRSSGRQFYVAGMNPQVLYCTNEIAADDAIVGGELFLPGYYKPTPINTDTEDGSTVLPFLDPFYAVMATAAEIAFNDIVYEDKATDLAGKANNLKRQMVRKNRRNTYGTIKPLPRNVRKIRNTETD